MRPLLSTGVSLAFLMAIGVAACSDTGENTTTTGSSTGVDTGTTSSGKSRAKSSGS